MTTPEKKDKAQKKVIYYEPDYTRTCKFKETDALPMIEFTYKPLNMVQSSQLTDEIMKEPSVEHAAECNLRMIGRHIISWNLEKPDGSVLDKDSVEELRLVDPTVINMVTRKIRMDKGTFAEDANLEKEEVKN